MNNDFKNDKPGLFLRIWPIGTIGATGTTGIIGAIVILVILLAWSSRGHASEHHRDCSLWITGAWT
jgi:hypothetical protein